MPASIFGGLAMLQVYNPSAMVMRVGIREVARYRIGDEMIAAILNAIRGSDFGSFRTQWFHVRWDMPDYTGMVPVTISQ